MHKHLSGLTNSREATTIFLCFPHRKIIEVWDTIGYILMFSLVISGHINPKHVLLKLHWKNKDKCRG